MFNKILFSVLLFQSIFIFGQGKVINKVVAQVGDNVILLSDLEVQKLQASSEGNEMNFPKECSILEQLLIEELLYNQALLDSLVVTDQSVDAEMENRLRIIESKMGSRQKLEEFYGKSTAEIKNEFRIQIKNKMLAQEMEQKLTKDLTVTPKEVATFFASIPKDSIPFINMKLGFQQIVNYPEITKADKKKGI